MNEDKDSRYIQPRDSLEAMELIQKLFNQYRRAPLTAELLAYHQNLIERLEGDIHQAAEAEGQANRVQELDRMIKLMKDWTAIRLSGRPFNAKIATSASCQRAARSNSSGIPTKSRTALATGPAGIKKTRPMVSLFCLHF